jgi:hypothetical protein
MGSGRGATRRAKANATTNIRVNAEPWHDFVAESDLGRQTLSEYYGVEPTNLDGTAEIATELLRDLIAIGCLTLPPDAQVSHFGFQLSGTTPNNYGTTPDARLHLTRHRVHSDGRSSRSSVQVGGQPHYHFAFNTKLSSGAIRNTVDYLLEAARHLCQD